MLFIYIMPFIVHEYSQYTGRINNYWFFKEEPNARKFYVEMVINYDTENEFDMDDWKNHIDQQKNHIDPHKYDCVQVNEDGDYVEIYEFGFED